MKHIDEIYKDWCGNSKKFDDHYPMHDSSNVIDFAKHYLKEMIDSGIVMEMPKYTDIEGVLIEVGDTISYSIYVPEEHTITSEVTLPSRGLIAESTSIQLISSEKEYRKLKVVNKKPSKNLTLIL